VGSIGVLQVNETDQRKIIFAINQCIGAVNAQPISGALVTIFGADPTGGRDSTSAFIQALATGQDVYVPAGLYKISSTLIIGNGTTSTQSKINGQRIIGLGVPGWAPAYSGTATSPVILQWIGAAAGTMVEVQGPMLGWGIQNISLDGNSIADTCLYMLSAQWGDCRDLTLTGFLAGNGLWFDTRSQTPFGSTQLANCMHNSFKNTTLQFSTAATSGKGIFLDGNSDLTSNSCYNSFWNTVFVCGGAPNIFALYLRNTDSNTFHGLHFFDAGSSTAAITFDYTGSSGAWPSSCTFYHVDPSGLTVEFQKSGTPNLPEASHFLYGLNRGNGATVPFVAGLNVGDACFYADSQATVYGAAMSTPLRNSPHTVLTLTNGLNSNIVWGSSTMLITGPTAAFSVGGFTFDGDGWQIEIFNPTAGVMTIVNEDLSSSAANRIITGTGANVTPHICATFRYFTTSGRWVATGYN
jgi:hypothetical protein